MYECDRGKRKTFYDKSFVIITESFTRDLNQYAPKIEIRDNAAFAIFRLSKLGYGTVSELKQMTSKEILQILNFERFNNDYENVITERIKKDKK